MTFLKCLNLFFCVKPQVITGLQQADESVIVNSDNCAQLLAHEATRVFHDRLVSIEDRTVFYQNLSDILHDYFKVPNTVRQYTLLNHHKHHKNEKRKKKTCVSLTYISSLCALLLFLNCTLLFLPLS